MIHAPAGWQREQGTLARELEIEGRGLHTGRRVKVRIVPVDPAVRGARAGIWFERSRGGRKLAAVPVDPSLRHGQPLCTMLRSSDGTGIRTVEHLLASLLTQEIDHATVHLDAEEVPILDGSATPWCDALRDAGRAPLAHGKRFVRVLKAVTVEQADGKEVRRMCIEPSDRYELDVRTDLRGFPDLRWQGTVTPAAFASEIAPSRSYGRLKWAVLAIAAGIVTGKPILRGARPSSTATIVGNSVMGGLRMPDEFVRHRALDLIGDLAMAGAPILGRVTAWRPSHEMNYRLLAALLADRDAWELAEVA
ncbi:UDP-3-O-acyl N-acetylglycosamine deacetylase [Caballeronia sp. LZ035]|nr:UDP-3-O-acyl N-acetylglycosamine deacetylase [Caballeronia sp. LZ035]MDR5757598.1 UDP-3-O-acyl N-acetylglycosamine deacetylase [Caballeronia sp. LZ035]